MTDSKKKTVKILLIVILVVIIAGVVWVVEQAQAPEGESPASEKTPFKSPETGEWKTYQNNVLGFSLAYPASWQITNNTLPQERRETARREHLEIMDAASPDESPRFTLWVNPMRFDSEPADIEYELILNQEGKVKIFSRKEILPPAESPTNIDEKALIVCKGARLGRNNYAFVFSSKDGGKDLESVLEEMLSTFKINTDLGWKTYKNTNHWFEMKYPKEWEVREVSGTIHFSNPNDENPYYIADIDFEPTNNQTLEDWLKKEVNTQCLKRLKNVRVGSVDGILVKQYCTIGYDYSMAVVPHRNNFVKIGYASSSTDLLEAILATFRFF